MWSAFELFRIVTLVGVVLGAQASADEARVQGGGRHKVALTFDDLPVHASLPAGMRRSDVARRLLEALRAHAVPPTYGFVNANSLGDEPDHAEVLRLWREAGHLLGNHTFSHMDLHANTVEAFGQDVVANEPTLRMLMGSDDWRWLRYPYLHGGETGEKRRAAARLLADRGYRIAQVSLNFDDWAFSDPYVRCLSKNDAAAVEQLQERYFRRASESLAADLARAARVFGRDVPHVMLLHAGAFQAATLPRLLQLLGASGFQFVTLQEAQSDSAYAMRVDRPFPSGATWLDEMAAIKGIETSRPGDDTLAQLATLCR
jgi:peptidoglycan/xylan/chitin deacetylase (PgdA/CDA1 family)